MNYIDTSVLVAALTTETHSTRAERWLAAGREDDLAISDWVIAEVSSALSIKLRLGSIDMGARGAALEALDVMISQSFVLLPVLSGDFRIAARFADQHQLGLRAPDALHLAIAMNHRATICTLDRRLAGAANALGVATTLL